MNIPAAKKATILAISGSLRANSSNAAVIKIIDRHARGRINFVSFKGLRDIPPFDDSNNIPPAVLKFRKQVQAADGVLICSPEYAFGVPGALKNAIDWTVSSGEFHCKPMALITAATGGANAHAQMLLILNALSASIPDSNQLLISFIKAKMDEKGNIYDDRTVSAVQAVFDSLLMEIAYQFM